MFCTKCGNQVPDGAKFCGVCGNALASAQEPVITPPVEEPVFEAPVQEPVYEAPVQEPVYEAPVQAYEPPAEEPAFALSTPATPKKKGKGKLVLGIIAAVLAVAVALAAFNWGSVSRFFIRSFGSPVAYMADVEKDNVAKTAENLATRYDEALATYSPKGTAVDANVSVEVGDALITLLSTALAQSGADMDLSWIDSIQLEPKINTYENTMQMDVGVGLNNTKIATVSVVWDMDSQTMWVGVPELHKTFVEMDAADTMGYEAEEAAESFKMSQQMTAAMMEALPSGDQLEKLINKYFGIIVDGIEDVEKSSEKMEIDGLEQKLTLLTATVSQKEAVQIVTDLLEAAQDDKTIEDILDALSDTAGMDLYEEFTYAVESTLEDMEDVKDEASNSKFLTIETYLDNKDDIVGRTLTVHMEGEKVEASYLTVTEGKEFTFEAEVDALTVTGEGTVEGEKRTGSYTFTVDGTDYLVLEVEDLLCTDEGDITGTVRLIPTATTYEMMDLPAAASTLLGQSALALTMEEESLKIGIETGGQTLLAMTLSGSTAKPSQVAIPEGVSTEDDAGGQKWLSELDFDAVLGNLKKAGVPESYMSAIEQLVSMLKSQMG